MDIGCIGYSNNSGLGQMLRGFRQHLPLDSQLIIPNVKGTQPLDNSFSCIEPFPSIEELEFYLSQFKPDIMIIIETPFNFEFLKILHDRKIKVIFIPMIDSVTLRTFERYLDYIDLVLHPTKMSLEAGTWWPGKQMYLPYPIDTDYFHPDKLDTTKEYMFLHNEGYSGMYRRKGTDIVLTAAHQFLSNKQYKDVKFLINTQAGKTGSAACMMEDHPAITINYYDFTEAIDTYKKGLVYIAPSRREGLGLSLIEAMACGLPVITTDAPPMNTWFNGDKRLLLSVYDIQDPTYEDSKLYVCNTLDTLRMFEWVYKNQDEVIEIGKRNREIVEKKFSWHALKEKYIDILEGLLK